MLLLLLVSFTVMICALQLKSSAISWLNYKGRKICLVKECHAAAPVTCVYNRTTVKYRSPCCFHSIYFDFTWPWDNGFRASNQVVHTTSYQLGSRMLFRRHLRWKKFKNSQMPSPSWTFPCSTPSTVTSSTVPKQGKHNLIVTQPFFIIQWYLFQWRFIIVQMRKVLSFFRW